MLYSCWRKFYSNVSSAPFLESKLMGKYRRDGNAVGEQNSKISSATVCSNRDTSGKIIFKTYLSLFIVKPTDALISQIYFCQETTCFGQFLCPSSGVFHCTFGTGICHASLITAFKYDQEGTASFILVVLESCHKTCMPYTSAECTVENSWWWAEELPETCRISWQK